MSFFKFQSCPKVNPDPNIINVHVVPRKKIDNFSIPQTLMEIWNEKELHLSLFISAYRFTRRRGMVEDDRSILLRM